MTYFEAFTCAKNPQRPETNEDQIVLRPGVVYAVLDGATDISGEVFDDELGMNAAGGRLASRAAARALNQWSGEDGTAPPDAAVIAAKMNAEIAALYDRLGRRELAQKDGAWRFRATFAGAFVWRDGIFLIRIGDSGFRVNGKTVLEHHFPADVVLSAARSRAWHLLASRGVDTDSVRKAARGLIVAGLSAKAEAADLGFQPADLSLIAEDVVARADVRAAVNGDSDLARDILAGGLRAVRADPGAVNALVLDGVSDVSSAIATAHFSTAEVKTLEIFTDGYPALPESTNIEAWEAALRHVDQTDSDRIGQYLSTKGCDTGKFGDDRSIIIARDGVDH